MKSLFRFITLILAVALLGEGIAFAQKTARGTVVDESGKPIPGVTVLVQGTTNGTIGPALF